MKRSLFLVFIVLIVQACSVNKNPEPSYVIVIQKDADTVVQQAAKQLQDYWKKITDRTISVTYKTSGNRKGIYIGQQDILPGLADSAATLKEDGFIIAINDNGIFLTGKTPKATMYAVNTLLEEYLGCLKFSAAEEYIPKTEEPVFRNGFKKYDPAFSFRRIHAPDAWDKDYSDWYKLEDLSNWGMYVHTFNKLLPPEKYYKEHPEYYSLVNGHRLQDAQLCLSNPEVVQLLIENLRDTIRKNPDKKYWSVSQNDTYNYCECENCRKLYKKYGSVSGAYVMMANKVAEAFPDKQISTLAYQFSRNAPNGIKPLPNVNIMLCTIECNRSRPLEENDAPHSFANDLKDWSKLTNNIYLWDYVVQFKNYLTPFPNFPVLQPNIQFFKKYGVDMLFEQASGHSWSDLIELKEFLLAKLEWDPDVNVDSLATLFINAYYGNAGKYIFDYYQTMNHEMQQHADSEFLNIYGFPSGYTNTFLKPGLMLYYEELMDNAEKAVAVDSVLLRRVWRTRMPVDFAFVDISVNNNFRKMPAIVKVNDKQEINPKIVGLLDKMEAYAATDPRVKVSERNFLVKDYKDYVLLMLRRKIQPNKLKGAEIILTTTYSEKYPVGGAKALNDNLFGPLDFHTNWLGFEGHDMIAVIDLKKSMEISEVQMNFLKAVNSWIFLPENITIEISEDGNDYHLLTEQKGDNSDRSYLVKSIPFDFTFDPVTARYLRVTAISMKTCPEWHRGYGKPSWIFVDEIIVN